jgi:hypothetical protein
MMQRLGISFEVREACLNHTIKGVAGTYNRYAYAAGMSRVLLNF